MVFVFRMLERASFHLPRDQAQAADPLDARSKQRWQPMRSAPSRPPGEGDHLPGSSCRKGELASVTTEPTTSASC
jgi:hypothetical protein